MSHTIVVRSWFTSCPEERFYRMEVAMRDIFVREPNPRLSGAQLCATDPVGVVEKIFLRVEVINRAADMNMGKEG